MDFSIKILTPPDVIQRKILEEMKKHIKNKWGTIHGKIENAFKDYIGLVVRNSEFYDNLLSGKLKTELGVVDASFAMSQIIDALRNTVVITVGDIKIMGNQSLKGIITLKAVPDDFQAALSTPMASYTSVNVKGESTLVPWLSWVLFEGTSPVVFDYKIVFGQPIFSRTGDAIMKKEPGGKWEVPTRFAGTSHTNFIFRALNDNLPELENILDKLLGGVF
jgi:hypothetical protein